jgi:hypothetical protein
MILNAALALLFYVCGHGFLFQSCSIGNPQYAPEVWHQAPGTPSMCYQVQCYLYESQTIKCEVMLIQQVSCK